MTDEHIQNTPLKMYKDYIKQKVRDAAFQKLEALKRGHSEVAKNQ